MCVAPVLAAGGGLQSTGACSSATGGYDGRWCRAKDGSDGATADGAVGAVVVVAGVRIAPRLAVIAVVEIGAYLARRALGLSTGVRIAPVGARRGAASSSTGSTTSAAARRARDGTRRARDGSDGATADGAVGAVVVVAGVGVAPLCTVLTSCDSNADRALAAISLSACLRIAPALARGPARR